MLKKTLNQIAVYDGSQSEEEMDSAEEEYLRMRYYEALRAQARQNEGMLASGHGSFQTPEQPDYLHYYVYGTEDNTASANYRPKNSSTALRIKPPKPQTGAKSGSKSQSKGKVQAKESSERQMNPDQDSFKISPIYSESGKANAKKVPRETTAGKSSNLSLSGSDERDFNFLGSEEKDREDHKTLMRDQHTQKSEPFIEVAQNVRSESKAEVSPKAPEAVSPKVSEGRASTYSKHFSVPS